MDVDIILPCLDEAAALPRVLDSLPPGCRALVVDNGSTDGSAEVARAHGATVVQAPVRGFGSAVHAGLLAARTEIVAICDADGSFDMRELPAVIDPVRRGDTDLCLGRRDAIGLLHVRWANAFLSWILRSRTSIDIHDLGPMRAARRQDLLDLDLRDRRSGYPLEMVVRAAEAHWRVNEVPVTFRPRIGRSKVTGTLRGTVQAVLDMSWVLRRVDGAVSLRRKGERA